MPTHFVAHWHHSNPEDPIRIYEEVGDDRSELRKVEQFSDGRSVRAGSITDDTTSLSWEPVPDMVEIEDQPEFTVELINAAEFEAVWAQSTDTPA